jgi:Ca2+-binding RTX toxin-like protein
MALAMATPSAGATHVLTAGEGGATLVGGAGADLILGGRGGDHLVGGGGDDTLIGHGAGPGQIDLLEGGAGDDRIYLAERTVAVGGDGKDTFVVPTPAATQPMTVQVAKPEGGTPEPPTAQQTAGVTGVVLDFSTDDRLVFNPSGRVVSVTQVADVLDGLHNYSLVSKQPATPGVKVGIDYDGDGTADTYVLLSGTGTSSITVGMKSGDAAFDPNQAEPAAHDQPIWPTGVSPAGSAAGDAILG